MMTSRALRIVLPGAALLLAGASQAAPPDQVGDYAYSIPLTLQKDSGVAALRLPPSVYLNSRSALLNDLRVFDSDGDRVPFALLAPPAQTQRIVTSLPVRVFPLMTEGGGAAPSNLRLDIRTDRNGRLLSVASSTRPAAATTATTAASAAKILSGLILEIPPGEHPSTAPQLSALRFELPPGTRDYQAQLWLETSDDLQHWTPTSTAELAWLSNADAQSLSSNRMAFPPIRFRYARVSWRSGTPLVFARIVAESDGGAVVSAMDTVTLRPVPEKDGVSLVYRAGIAIPAERVGMEFSETNAILPAVLGTYRQIPNARRGHSHQLMFEPVLSTTFYRISQAGAERNSGDTAIRPTQAALWVARTQTGSAARPALRLSWSPSTLLFLANGNGPYQLAFGRSDAMRAALRPSQVAPGFSTEDLPDLPRAQPGELASHKEGAALAGTAFQTAILWTALLAGLALLAYFVHTLLRQMNRPDKTA